MTKSLNKKLAFTMVEILVAIAIFSLLSTAIYSILRSMRQSFTFAQNKLDVLQGCRIIMAGLRNELRTAVKKPETTTDRIIIQLEENTKDKDGNEKAGRTIVYYFDETEKRLYRGEQEGGDQTMDKSEMHPYNFSDGQILTFDWDSSYSKEKFVESELALNSKIWFQVTIKVLYSIKADKLSESEMAAIIASLDTDTPDDRVKTFTMKIAPRVPNWQLQTTQ